MSIGIGDRLPNTALTMATPDGPKPTTVEEVFAGKRAVLFAVPGAFTPTCSARHLPGFLDKAVELKAKGIDLIACVAVNDAFVMRAWAESQDVADDILMLADGAAEFTKALGLEMDAGKLGLGLRSRRYAMVLDDAVVMALNVEEAGEFRVSSAEHVLSQL